MPRLSSFHLPQKSQSAPPPKPIPRSSSRPGSALRRQVHPRPATFHSPMSASSPVGASPAVGVLAVATPRPSKLSSLHRRARWDPPCQEGALSNPISSTVFELNQSTQLLSCHIHASFLIGWFSTEFQNLDRPVSIT